MVSKDLLWRQMTDSTPCGSLQKLVTSPSNCYSTLPPTIWKSILFRCLGRLPSSDSHASYSIFWMTAGLHVVDLWWTQNEYPSYSGLPPALGLSFTGNVLRLYLHAQLWTTVDRSLSFASCLTASDMIWWQITWCLADMRHSTGPHKWYSCGDPGVTHVYVAALNA